MLLIVFDLYSNNSDFCILKFFNKEIKYIICIFKFDFAY